MSLRLAVIYKEKDIFVEFTTEKFIELLEKYYKKLKSVRAAVEAISADLKKEILKK